MFNKKLVLFGLFYAFLSMHSAVFAAEHFNIKDTKGKNHNLAQYKGKWVIVNYWATWCPPCLEEVPDLVAFYETHKSKDATVIGVAIDFETASEVQEYVDDMLMTYPIVLGEDNVKAQFAATDVLPTTFVYNPKGELVVTKHGLITKQALEDIIKPPKAATSSSISCDSCKLKRQ
jgi:thiol-disulfide isomerase/thioredoxin